MARAVDTSGLIGCLVVVLLGMGAPARAQFICGGSATGAEPQTGGTSSGSAGSVACGLGVSASGPASVAVGTALPGSEVRASGARSIAIGTGNFFGIVTQGADSIAIGTDTFTDAASSGQVAIGRNSSAQGSKSIAIGDNANINGGGSNNLAIGGSNLINGSNDVVLGANVNALGPAADNVTAVGAGSTASGNNSTAMGQGATASGVSSTALGQGSTAAFANSTAIGSGVTTTRANQVAVGTATNTYTLAGVSSAASLAAQSGPLRVVTTDAAGNLATASFAPQDISTLQSSVGVLQQQMKQAFEGTAIAIALGGTALPDNKKFAISTNWGNFRGQNAAGVSAQYRISNNLVANVGLGGGFQQGGIGSRAGVTLAW